jgi:hypothetical protein
MDQGDLETCPRCGGTGVDPDPDGADSQSQNPFADGFVAMLFASLFDWIMRKILPLLFPKLHARCRYCRGAGRVPILPLQSN